MRARVTSENLGIASWKVEIGSTTSSGESSFVNASLKVNAVNMRTPISETVIERGFRCPMGCVSRLRSQAYVARIRDQRNLGFVAINVFTISGDPANFWPVWFQPRMMRVAPRTMANQTQVPPSPLLWTTVSECEGLGLCV